MRKGTTTLPPRAPVAPRRCAWYAPGGGCGRCVPCRAVLRAQAVGDSPPADATCAAADGLLCMDVGDGFRLALDRRGWRHHAFVQLDPPATVNAEGVMTLGTTIPTLTGRRAGLPLARLPAHVATRWMQQWRWTRAASEVMLMQLQREAGVLYREMEVRSGAWCKVQSQACPVTARWQNAKWSRQCAGVQPCAAGGGGC